MASFLALFWWQESLRYLLVSLFAYFWVGKITVWVIVLSLAKLCTVQSWPSPTLCQLDCTFLLLMCGKCHECTALARSKGQVAGTFLAKKMRAYFMSCCSSGKLLHLDHFFCARFRTLMPPSDSATPAHVHVGVNLECRDTCLCKSLSKYGGPLRKYTPVSVYIATLFRY